MAPSSRSARCAVDLRDFATRPPSAAQEVCSPARSTLVRPERRSGRSVPPSACEDVSRSARQADRRHRPRADASAPPRSRSARIRRRRRARRRQELAAARRASARARRATSGRRQRRRSHEADRRSDLTRSPARLPRRAPHARQAAPRRHRPRTRHGDGGEEPSSARADRLRSRYPDGWEQACKGPLLPAAGCRTGCAARSLIEPTAGVPRDAPMRCVGSECHRWVPAR